MWRYEKRIQYPVNIKEPNAKIAKYIMSQYGGPDGRGDKKAPGYHGVAGGDLKREKVSVLI